MEILLDFFVTVGDPTQERAHGLGKLAVLPGALALAENTPAHPPKSPPNNQQTRANTMTARSFSPSAQQQRARCFDGAQPPVPAEPSSPLCVAGGAEQPFGHILQLTITLSAGRNKIV